MSENAFDIERVRQKFEDLDNDVDSFIQSIREIKEIRNSVGSLPERLKQSEETMESQRKDLDRMMSSTSNLLMTFEEQSKGIIFDLEKKTADLTGEVKTSISQIGNILNQSNDQLKDQYMKQSDDMLKKYKDLKQSLEILKNVVGDQQQTVNALKNEYTAGSKIFDTMEPSLAAMKKSIAALQARPQSSAVGMHDMEERLKELIQQKGAKQTLLTWSMFIILLTGFLYFLFAFYIH